MNEEAGRVERRGKLIGDNPNGGCEERMAL
jgi:hypothetical protein